MELTSEQYDIINSTGDIKINAVAGSGKTTTVIEYARSRPQTSRILYLAFNKSVRLDAAKKFAEKGLRNVQVETAHSLAFKHIVPQNGYIVSKSGYKTNEIVEWLKLKGDKDKHTQYIIANHIIKLVAFFCNSTKQKVQELNYIETITDPKAQTFVTGFYPYILEQARILLSRMNKGEVEITHDFYLKKFQLANPVLHFDYILFDEGQDASPAMLNIFLKQKATKVIVGDTHQQIYSWRYAVNSLEQADFTTYLLSASFRFGQQIARLAMEVLTMKKHLNNYTEIPITGKGTGTETKTRAVLARTNLGLLLRAIEYITEAKKVQHIYFEGNIHSYTYADEGASLYDVLNLNNGNRHLVKDKLIKTMDTLADLEEYIEQTEDAQLAMMVEIVKEYGNEIPAILKKLKDKHVNDSDKHKAEMIFSTVHRCKGMEYDIVYLANDFITREKLEKLTGNKHIGELNTTKLNEEINLLYVAVTRARHCVYIPEAIVPENFPQSKQVQIVKSVMQKEENRVAGTAVVQHSPKTGIVKPKAYTVKAVRDVHRDAYKPWTTDLDNELTVMYCEGVKLKDMANHFGRTRGAIISRIKALELRELYG